MRNWVPRIIRLQRGFLFFFLFKTLCCQGFSIYPQFRLLGSSCFYPNFRSIMLVCTFYDDVMGFPPQSESKQQQKMET